GAQQRLGFLAAIELDQSARQAIARVLRLGMIWMVAQEGSRFLHDEIAQPFLRQSRDVGIGVVGRVGGALGREGEHEHEDEQERAHDLGSESGGRRARAAEATGVRIYDCGSLRAWPSGSTTAVVR